MFGWSSFAKRLALQAKALQDLGAVLAGSQHLDRDALLVLLVGALREINDRGAATPRFADDSIVPDAPADHVAGGSGVQERWAGSF